MPGGCLIGLENQALVRILACASAFRYVEKFVRGMDIESFSYWSAHGIEPWCAYGDTNSMGGVKHEENF